MGIISSIITKKEPWATLGIIGGGLVASLGVLDATGMLSPLLQKFGLPGDSSSGYAGSYAVTANNLPFDPNNYYLPPRDRSIAP